MKKNKILLLFAFVLFILLPFNVYAVQIVIEPSEGENLSIEVEKDDTIEAIKDKIFNTNNNYPVGKQRLYYNNDKMENGRTFRDYYSDSLGNIIKMELESVNMILNANGGLFTDKEEYIIEDIYGSENIDIVIPTREGYVFKSFYTEKDGGLNIYYYTENHVIENDIVFYAHWDEIGTVTLDFTKIINGDNFTNLEKDLLQILIENQILISDQSDKSFKNISGKILIKGDNEGNLTPVEGLTSAYNIDYTLSDDDKQSLMNEYDESYIPKIVKVIVSKEKEYKVIFDANGGVFKDGKNIMNFDNWYWGMLLTQEQPIREEYKFKGWYIDKEFKIPLAAEPDMANVSTIYAKWELNQEVPKTLDNITSSILVGILSLIGLVGTTIYLKNKVRA